MSDNLSGPTNARASGALDFDDVSRWRYLSKRKLVTFSVFVDREEIRCAVTQEYLEDTYGDNKDVLGLAREHAEAIADKIEELVAAQCFDADGSIVLRSVATGFLV